jgi:putative heme-binding domain-containing protein
LEVIADRSPDESNTEFLLSRDPSFRPVQIVNGPEGGLYIADLSNGGDSGRIFRIVPDTYKSVKPPPLGKATTRDLVVALAQPNGWQRDTSGRLLTERRDPSAVALLTSMLNNSQLPVARLQALSVLDGMGALNEGHIFRGLRDLDENVRNRAVLLSEKLISNGVVSDVLWNELKAMAGDASIRVRYQFAFTLGEFSAPAKSERLAHILSRNPDNPWIQAALLSSAFQGAADLLVATANGSGWNDANGGPFVARLAMLVGLQNRQPDVQQVIDFLDKSALNHHSVFTLLAAFGEGLHRAGSSLSAADPQRRLQRFYDQCYGSAFNDALPERLRIEALQLTGVTPYASYTQGDIFQLVFGTAQSDAIQSATMDALARYANPAIPNNIFGIWPQLNRVVRKRAIAALLTRGDWLEAVVSALESGIIRPADFSSPQMDLLRNWPVPSLAQRARQVLGPTVIRRTDLLEQFKPSLTMPGSVARGREFFNARCLVCHKPADGRQAFDLDLAPVKLYGRQKVLSAIVEPNAEVPAPLATHLAQTRANEIWTGLLADGNPSTITLTQPGRDTVVLPRANLQYFQSQSWSLMPAGLETGLTQQDMADLLEYLTPGVSYPP